MRTVIRGGQIFDVVGGEVSAGDVVLQDGVIREVGPGLDGDAEFDATGLTVLPGLIDAHVHVMVPYFDVVRLLETPFSQFFYLAEQTLKKTLDLGITYVRDANGADLGVQTAVAQGLIDGPDLDISIQALGQTGGHSDFWMPAGACVPLLPTHPGRPEAVVDGAEAMRMRVRELIRAGANVIKLNVSGGVISPRGNPQHPQLRVDEIEEAVAEATAAGIYVMAHAHSTEGIKRGLRAGIRSVEHGTYLDDECIQLMLDNGTWLVPTLGVVGALLDGIASGVKMPDAVVAKLHGGREAHLDSVRRAIDAGVRIAMGSDAAALGHGRNLDELAQMHALGMSPADVLRTATSSAAALMRHEDIVGAVDPGKRGDLTLVVGDPFDFKAYPGNVRAVFKRGVKVRDFTAAA
jgi:imidazolonepropionase-like amidohydrolase